MGTDIRMYPEKRSGGQWQFIGEMVEDEYYFEYGLTCRPESLYNMRNYNLFAILADIRNDDIEDTYEFIAPLRGFPDDLSAEVKIWSEFFQPNVLSASWLTLEELLTFDWYGKKKKKYARVDERVAHLFHPERGFPFSEWPQGIRCSSYSASKEGCNAIWTQTYAEAAGSVFMELLNDFSKTFGVSNDVRFILWFD